MHTTIGDEAFWKWFVEHADTLGDSIRSSDRDAVSRMINSRVSSLKHANEAPTFNWEVGPGTVSRYCFALSPVVRRNIKRGAEIIAKAPVLEDWELHLYKCPKPEPACFQAIFPCGGRPPIHVDGSNWTYCLFNDGDIADLIVIADVNVSQMPIVDRTRIVETIADNTIGEEHRLRSIGRILLIDRSEIRKSIPERPILLLRTEIMMRFSDA